MTRVCFVGEAEVNLRYELLSRETAREALQTYDLRTPFHNSVGVETVSLGAAVALANDLNWYVVRFVDAVIVQEPSVSETEWLSRDLATAIRDDAVAPAETGRYLKVYGMERGHGATTPDAGAPSAGEADAGGPDPGEERETGPDGEPPADTGSSVGQGAGDASPLAGGGSGVEEPPRLVEPMFVTRRDGAIPEYDLREVDETLVVRVTEAEFGA